MLPRGHLEIPGDILGCPNSSGSLVGEGQEGRDAANLSTMHSCLLPQRIIWSNISIVPNLRKPAIGGGLQFMFNYILILEHVKNSKWIQWVVQYKKMVIFPLLSLTTIWKKGERCSQEGKGEDAIYTHHVYLIKSLWQTMRRWEHH